MDNNDMYGLTKINFANVPTDVRKTVRGLLDAVDIGDLQKSIEDINKKCEAKFSFYDERLDEADERLNDTVEQISVIGFGIHSKKFGIFQKICRSRVHKLLGGMCDCNYILWSRYFYQRIYIDIADCLEVGGCRNINIKDYEKTKSLAYNWKPSDAYVYNKTKELIERRDKGQLSQNRCMALYMYLENTENGKVNPF